jgi:cobalt-zinc-cadmium efflux system membrane fusion protein
MAQIFGSDIDAVSVGDSAQVTVGTKTVAGRVENISAEVDPNTRSVVARVTVDNSRGLLKKQMYVHVRIQSHEASRGILAPVSSILRDDENLPFVYVRQRDGSFARRRVTVGDRVGDNYEIPTGLEAGDRIVIDGAIFVQFMQDQ